MSRSQLLRLLLTNVSVFQQELQEGARPTEALGFFTLPTAPELYDTGETVLPEQRERGFPPTDPLFASPSAGEIGQSVSVKAAVDNRPGQNAPAVSPLRTGGTKKWRYPPRKRE
jgi:hypothetical protein